ncbi:amidohydrolase family protein [Gracilibacillus sp. D59]|uniref:amidohydrolase family protein n=1 Tax=Gracilibacillus sp. D59 TaxID=3457434 RepID=UPI003FCE6F7F
MKIFDSHLHIIDTKFPLIKNQGYIPDPFTSQDYLHSVNNFNVVGGAVVSGSFQGFDQSYLIDALQTLGENFVGVTQLPYTTPDDEIIKLHKLGVRAIRFNVNRGGSEDISRLDYFARRVYELVNWHTELYINSKSLTEIATTVEKLPAVSIDHLGLSKSGFSTLLSLVDKGVKVKATGFGRIDFDPGEAIRNIYSINPDALMFGTDLPSTRANRPFNVSDLELVYDVLDENQVEKVLYKNAFNWYLK